MIKEITIPEISENVTSGSVVEVLVNSGDRVAVDDPIIEFETDKAVVEIPSPFAGRITEILVKAGDELKVGDPVAKLDTDAQTTEDQEDKQAGESQSADDEDSNAAPEEDRREEPAAKPSPREGTEEPRSAAKAPEESGATGKSAAEKEGEAQAEPEQAQETLQADPAASEKPAAEAETAPAEEQPSDQPPAPASPSVRRLARELGVDIHDVHAAGPGARISAADVKAFVQRQQRGSKPEPGAASASAAAPQPAEAADLPDFSRWGEVEDQDLSAVRRLTAQSVGRSHQQVVPVTQFEEADITEVEAFIGRKADAVADQGGKLTLTAVLIKICALGLQRFPQFNASIDMENNRLIYKHYVHIGVAVDTPRGLLVPVLRHAERKSISELAVEVVDLARRTRNKKINPDEL
ncbi:MAG: dihydrolipoamide acetyltransferase family protein, partial [Desulfobacterales bacterium]